MECEDENISRTDDYDDSGGDNNDGGDSGDELTDEFTDRLEDQVGRSQDRVRQLPSNDPPKQALADKGRTSSDEAKYLAKMASYLINLIAAPSGAVFV